MKWYKVEHRHPFYDYIYICAIYAVSPENALIKWSRAHGYLTAPPSVFIDLNPLNENEIESYRIIR